MPSHEPAPFSISLLGNGLAVPLAVVLLRGRSAIHKFTLYGQSRLRIADRLGVVGGELKDDSRDREPEQGKWK